MAKMNAKEIYEEVKREDQFRKRKNYTFRLDEALMKKFSTKCQKDKVPMSSVLEKFLKDLVGEG